MFERYSEPAVRTLFFARYEANQLGGVSIETEHVLLGLFREPGALVGRICVDAGISYQGVRAEIDAAATARPRIPTSDEMPLSEETQRVLQYAADEAGRLADGHVGTEHLLLGLLRERGGTAGRSLARKGLTVERVRTQIQDERASPTSAPSSHPSTLDALNALERASSLLGQIFQHDDPTVRDVVQIVQLELDLARRALNP